MTINSKQKGNRYERELAKTFRAYGFTEARRGVQYSGKQGEADDVVGLPHIHIEAKHVERLNLYEAIKQAERDANPDEFPCVFHRRNRTKTYVTMSLDDWMALYITWLDIREKADKIVVGGSK